MFSAWWSGAGKTFAPRRQHRPGTRQYSLHRNAEVTLGSGNLREAVACPDGEDTNEWLACKTLDLYNEVSLVHGMVAEFCTSVSCPIMCAGKKWEYKCAPLHSPVAGGCSHRLQSWGAVLAAPHAHARSRMLHPRLLSQVG